MFELTGRIERHLKRGRSPSGGIEGALGLPTPFGHSLLNPLDRKEIRKIPLPRGDSQDLQGDYFAGLTTIVPIIALSSLQ
jgi:hypothetical protein